MGGGAGAGKGTYLRTVDTNLKGDNYVYVDPDEIKKSLPDYYFKGSDSEGKRIPKKKGAAFTHEESSALAKAIIEKAQNEGYNVVWDGTGAGSVEKMRAKIKAAKDKGMKVKGAYVTVPIDIAIDRVRQRGIDTGRFVPGKTVIRIHKQVHQIFPEIAKDFDEISLWDNSQEMGKPMTLVYEGKNGKSNIKDKNKWNDFVSWK